MFILRRVRADRVHRKMQAYLYRNRLADLPVNDSRIFARVSSAFSPATKINQTFQYNMQYINASVFII
jgi:hypothetical protein